MTSKEDLKQAMEFYCSLEKDSIVIKEAATIFKKLAIDHLESLEKFTRKEVRFIRSGEKISAVRSVMKRLKLGLIDAKRHVESHSFYAGE